MKSFIHLASPKHPRPLECRSWCCMLVLMLAAATNGMAQNLTVTGKVTDNGDGRGIPGVSVLVKGTSAGTITDATGAYTIRVEEQSPVLVFSFVGMHSQEVEVGQRTVIDVSMLEDVRQLSEIVVTGSGVPVEKRSIAFAVESVTASKLPNVPTASIDQALIGRIPGAQISSVNGTPGSEVSILLRGVNTVNGNTQPIIVVDGVQMAATQFSSLDPSNIERVEVIQGAAASTIYGAQGANGVIQVFTKRGKANQLRVDFSISSGVNEFINAGGLRKSKLHGFETDGLGRVTVAGDTSTLLVQNDTTLVYNGNTGYNLLSDSSNWNKPYDQNLKYHDHIAQFLKPAQFYSTSINISGGSEKTDFNIGVSKMHQESTFNGSGYNERTNVSVNVGTEIAPGLHLRSITQLIYNQNTVNVLEKPDFGLNSAFFNLFTTQPFADFGKRDIDGNYGAAYGLAAGAIMFNPNYSWQYSSTLDNKIDILQNFDLRYAFPKYVDIDVLYGINYQTRELKHEIRNQSLNRNSVASSDWLAWNNFNDNTGEITTNNNKRTFQNFKTTANVRLDFDKDFHLGIPLRSTTQVAYDYRSDALSKMEFYALGMPVVPPASSIQGTDFGIYQDYREDFVTFGYLVTERLEYGDVAGISGGFRSDYSSAFGRGSKPFTFPRADGFFRVSGLNFWNSSGLSKTILEWKIRAAYGEAGIQPRPFDRYVTLGSKPVGNSNALYIPGAQSNPDLNVEVSKEFEAGTDMFLEGMKGNWLKGFELAFTYWTRRTDNAIYSVQLPPSSGVTSRIDNALALESNGIQASLIAHMVKSRSFAWNMTVNFSKQRSMIAEVNVPGGELIAGNRILKAGEPVGAFYGWHMLRSLDEKKPNGDPFIDPSQQSNYSVASNGWVVNNTSKQPFISSERYGMGNPNPDFIMSWINEFTYKDFLVASFQFDGMSGNKLYNESKQWMYRDGIHADYEKEITINGETGAWSAFYQGCYTNAKWEKNYFVEDASFLRLRTVSVGINFARLFKIRSVDRLQLVLTGRNLLTFTNYSGMDPEVGSYSIPNHNYANFTSLQRGIDSFAFPNSRSYQLTLNIGL